MPSHEERIGALVAEAKALVEEISSDGRQAVAGAEAEADRNVRRFSELRDERESLSAEAGALRDELDGMPVLHSKAVLEDDVEEELRLKDRYGNARGRLSEISSRLPEVEAEIRKLSPRGENENEASLHQYAAVNKAAAAPLVQLRRLGGEVHDAAIREAGHFEGVLEERRGESWAWRQDVAWTEENRERLRSSRSVPGEDRTGTIRADPSRLEGGGEPRRVRVE